MAHKFTRHIEGVADATKIDKAILTNGDFILQADGSLFIKINGEIVAVSGGEAFDPTEILAQLDAMQQQITAVQTNLATTNSNLEALTARVTALEGAGA